MQQSELLQMLKACERFLNDTPNKKINGNPHFFTSYELASKVSAAVRELDQEQEKQAKQQPVTEDPKKVFVTAVVSGGVLQSAYSTDPNIVFDVIDFDNWKAEPENEGKDEDEHLAEETKGMTAIY